MDDEFAFAEPLPHLRPGAFMRAYRWVTTRRHGRLLEFAFFFVPGLALAALAAALDARGYLNDPIAIIVGFVGVVYAGFGFLPPLAAEAPAPPNPKSLRAKRRP